MHYEIYKQAGWNKLNNRIWAFDNISLNFSINDMKNPQSIVHKL